MRCFLLILLCATGLAAELPWPAQKYSHRAENEPLPALLRDFFADMGVPVVISERVDGLVTGSFVNCPPKKFFNQMIRAYGLISYYDGNVLYIYASEEMRSEVIVLQSLSYQRLETVLAGAGMLDATYPLESIDEEGIVFVTGPSRYVELVAQTAGMLENASMRRRALEGAETTIRVFPLSYAWAADQTFTEDENQQRLPGVATILRDLIAGSSATTGNGAANPNTVPKLKGRGLAGNWANDRDGRDESAPPVEEETDQNAVGINNSVIQADPRLNAVVIRGKRADMPFFEQLITTLDTPVGLVEIRAGIIDISTDYSHELGIDWRYEKSGEISGGFDTNIDQLPGNQPFPGGEGLQLTTIIGNAAEFFLSRIKALEQDGNARIFSKPSVLTLDNVEARLEHDETFFVRVAGDREVDLFNVSAGVKFRVTPHIIQEPDSRRVKLAIRIEDGGFSGETVDGIPVVRNTTLQTQAIVGEDESLLIGGHIIDREISGLRQVPGLGRIPVFKHLFRSKRKKRGRVERMFLITPRIVPNDLNHPGRQLNHPDTAGLLQLSEPASN